MKMQVESTPEFRVWLASLNKDEQIKIKDRVVRIREEGHLGDFKSLGDGLLEMRWRNGWRIYFMKQNKILILILIGGLKNDQKADIKKARAMLGRYS